MYSSRLMTITLVRMITVSIYTNIFYRHIDILIVIVIIILLYRLYRLYSNIYYIDYIIILIYIVIIKYINT